MPGGSPRECWVSSGHPLVSICTPTLQMRKQSPVIVPGSSSGAGEATSSRLEPGVISGYALLPTEKPKKAQTKAGSWSLGAQPLRQPAAPLRWTPSQSESVPATFQSESACGQLGLRRLYFRACGLPGLIDTLTLLRRCQARHWGREILEAWPSSPGFHGQTPRRPCGLS